MAPWPEDDEKRRASAMVVTMGCARSLRIARNAKQFGFDERTSPVYPNSLIATYSISPRISVLGSLTMKAIHRSTVQLPAASKMSLCNLAARGLLSDQAVDHPKLVGEACGN
jgi:hypothetical protein